jgi:hypothetical protein
MFEREEGYFTSSMAINLVISELIVTAIALPLAANPGIPLFPIIAIGAPLALLLPLVFFHHSRSLWLSMDHFLNPISAEALRASQDFEARSSKDS